MVTENIVGGGAQLQCHPKDIFGPGILPWYFIIDIQKL